MIRGISLPLIIWWLLLISSQLKVAVAKVVTLNVKRNQSGDLLNFPGEENKWNSINGTSPSDKKCNQSTPVFHKFNEKKFGCYTYEAVCEKQDCIDLGYAKIEDNSLKTTKLLGEFINNMKNCVHLANRIIESYDLWWNGSWNNFLIDTSTRDIYKDYKNDDELFLLLNVVNNDDFKDHIGGLVRMNGRCSQSGSDIQFSYFLRLSGDASYNVTFPKTTAPEKSQEGDTKSGVTKDKNVLIIVMPILAVLVVILTIGACFFYRMRKKEKQESTSTPSTIIAPETLEQTSQNVYDQLRMSQTSENIYTDAAHVFNSAPNRNQEQSDNMHQVFDEIATQNNQIYFSIGNNSQTSDSSRNSSTPKTEISNSVQSQSNTELLYYDAVNVKDTGEQSSTTSNGPIYFDLEPGNKSKTDNFNHTEQTGSQSEEKLHVQNDETNQTNHYYAGGKQHGNNYKGKTDHHMEEPIYHDPANQNTDQNINDSKTQKGKSVGTEVPENSQPIYYDATEQCSGQKIKGSISNGKDTKEGHDPTINNSQEVKKSHSYYDVIDADSIFYAEPGIKNCFENATVVSENTTKQNSSNDIKQNETLLKESFYFQTEPTYYEPGIKIGKYGSEIYKVESPPENNPTVEYAKVNKPKPNEMQTNDETYSTISSEYAQVEK